MGVELLLQRIATRLEAQAMTERQALLRAKLKPDTIRNMRRRKNLPKLGWLPAFAEATNTPIDYFLSAVVPRGSPVSADLIARRFAAARWACWDDDFAAAEEDLGVPEAEIRDIEKGALAPSDELLLKFHLVSGFPIWWFREGRWDGIPSLEAGRAGAFAPELIEDSPEARGAGPSEPGPGGKLSAA